MQIATVPEPFAFSIRSLIPRSVSALLLTLVLVVCAATPGIAAELDPGLLSKVQAATFEVVIPKPVDDPLKYEKPLPLDQLPYQFRNDKYFSIGTAFALGNDRYVTAAHVPDVGIGSLMGTPALRDASGHVYAIDQITKFSLGQDFVVFSLVRQPPDVVALGTDTAPGLNQVVYAVGNALGTGVVVRDGLYTSETPEDQDGRWKWIRFSAAASPGNSGGPLLDKDGKVIGIVVMKSPSENLNYALPIGEVLKAPDNLALINKRMNYQPGFFDTTQTAVFKQQFALPKSFADFSATYLKFGDAFADEQLKALRDKNVDQLFPHGSGSNRLLHASVDLHTFPSLVHHNSNGIWVPSRPQQNRELLPHNGYVATGGIGNLLLVHLRKPDDLSASQLYGNAGKYMDLLLSGWSFTRSIGTEKVRITSLGKPTGDSMYTDAYQRHWQVRTWPLAYADGAVISFSLPVPDGYVTIIRLAPAGDIHPIMIDMQATCDFVDMSYGGTLAQWKDYLTNTALLPGALSGIRLDFDYGHHFSYHSNRLDFSYTPELQKIEQDSYLTLGFSYINDRGKVNWDVRDVEVKADAHSEARLNLNRHIAPTSDLDDSYRSRWEQLKQRKHPDDSIVYSHNDMTQIGTVAGQPDDSSSVLYTVFFAAEGAVPQAAMKDKLDLLLKNLRVTER